MQLATWAAAKSCSGWGGGGGKQWMGGRACEHRVCQTVPAIQPADAYVRLGVKSMEATKVLAPLLVLAPDNCWPLVAVTYEAPAPMGSGKKGWTKPESESP